MRFFLVFLSTTILSLSYSQSSYIDSIQNTIYSIKNDSLKVEKKLNFAAEKRIVVLKISKKSIESVDL